MTSSFLLVGTLALILVVTYYLNSESDLESVQEFALWMKKHDKNYSSNEEMLHRYFNFLESKKRIANHKSTSYTVALNQFSDMTDEELKATYLNPMPPQSIKTVAPILSLNGVPESIDWTTKGAVTDVMDQGKCGSCYAFSAVGALEGYWKVKGNSLVKLSVQQLLDCSKKYHNKGCAGGWMDWAFDYVWDYKITSAAKYPYEGIDKECSFDDWHDGIFSISGYSYVPHNDEQQLKAAIAKQPISVSIAVDPELFHYESGFYEGKCAEMVNHGVLAVGYGEENGRKYFKVKNSWGQKWGEQGFVKFPREEGDLGGKCYVANQGVYPKL